MQNRPLAISGCLALTSQTALPRSATSLQDVFPEIGENGVGTRRVYRAAGNSLGGYGEFCRGWEETQSGVVSAVPAETP